MKKIGILILTVAMLFSLVSCAPANITTEAKAVLATGIGSTVGLIIDYHAGTPITGKVTYKEVTDPSGVGASYEFKDCTYNNVQFINGTASVVMSSATGATNTIKANLTKYTYDSKQHSCTLEGTFSGSVSTNIKLTKVVVDGVTYNPESL